MSLKAKIIKTALKNKGLRPHLLNILLKQAMDKTVGSVWLEEFVEGKDPEKGLKKVRERDFKELKKRALETMKREEIPEKLQFSEASKRKEEVLKFRLQEIERLKKEAVASVERKFESMLKEAQTQLEEWQKEGKKIKEEAAKLLQKQLKEIQAQTPTPIEESEGTPLADYIASSGNWAPKFTVEKVSTVPVTKVEAQTTARRLGQDFDRWSNVALAVPVGKDDEIEGWILSAWSAE